MKTRATFVLTLLFLGLFSLSTAEAQAVRLDGRTATKRKSTRINDAKLSVIEANKTLLKVEDQRLGGSVSANRSARTTRTTPRTVVVTRELKNKQKRNITSFATDP